MIDYERSANRGPDVVVFGLTKEQQISGSCGFPKAMVYLRSSTPEQVQFGTIQNYVDTSSSAYYGVNSCAFSAADVGRLSTSRDDLVLVNGTLDFSNLTLEQNAANLRVENGLPVPQNLVTEPPLSTSPTEENLLSESVGVRAGRFREGATVDDIAISDRTNNRVRIALNDGSAGLYRFAIPGFSEPGTIVLSVLENPEGIDIGQLSDDGRIDIAVACAAGPLTFPRGGVAVLRKNSSDATFDSGVAIQVLNSSFGDGGGPEARFVRVGDLNKDGRDDLVVTGRRGWVSVVLNDLE